MFTVINLSQLPPPDIIEELDFETILQTTLDDFTTRYPEFDAPVESDPGYKLLETCAYRELVLRQRINDAVRAVMLPTATGTDLDNIFPQWVTRQTIVEADPEAVPPVEAVLEDDTSLRNRNQLALESYTSAGSIGAYTFYALSADAQVKDVSITQPQPGTVLVSVISHEPGDGTASTTVLDAVEAALSAETVRPLCDTVQVQTATIVSYTINATLTFFTGPDKSIVLAAALAAIEQYTNAQHRIGQAITISGIHAALHQPGVQNVDLTSPASDIAITDTQAPYCTNIDLTDGGLYD